MDWSNERYVRLYTRDTETWKLLTWEGRALLTLLLRKVDRAGVLETKHGARGVAALVELPLDLVERGLPQLLEDGTVAAHAVGYYIPKFLEAQEAPASDALRQKEARERRRLGIVTNRDGSVTNRDAGVTFRDETSRWSEAPVKTSLQPSSLPSDPASLPTQKLVAQGALPGVGGKPKAGKKPPLPFTVADLLGDLHQTSSGLFAKEPFDPGLATPITRVIRVLGDQGMTLIDVGLAGEFIAAGGLGGHALAPGWVAKTGTLVDAIGKARRWRDEGRPPFRRGNGSAPPQQQVSTPIYTPPRRVTP